MRKLRIVLIITAIAAAILVWSNPLRLIIFKMPPPPHERSDQNLAQLLGHPRDAKLLVVNSDDTGAHPAFTDGYFEVASSGMVLSTSIIVNDRNDTELKRIAEWQQQNPGIGIGIHLNLNCEYQDGYPWAPVASREIAPTLYNESDLAWEKVDEVLEYVDPAHALIEFEAQVLKAVAAGIELSHIDSHMGTIYLDSRYPGADKDGLRMAALQIAQKYELPMTANTFDRASKAVIEQMDASGIIRPEVFFGFYALEDMNSADAFQGSKLKKWLVARLVKWTVGFELPYENTLDRATDIPIRMSIYQHALRSLAKPGLNHIFVHVSKDGAAYEPPIPRGLHHDEGIDRIARLGDAAVWTSETMRSFLDKEGFVLINYNEIRDLQRSLN